MIAATRIARLGTVLLVSSLATGFTAGADAQYAAPVPTSGSTGTCVLSGTAAPPPDLLIYDEPVGGKVIGRFTGGSSALRASHFPSDGRSNRARVATGTGVGSFRLTGYAEAARLPLYTAAPVAISPGHLSIAAHRAVRPIVAQGDRVEVEKRLTTPLRQSFRGLAPCSALTFAQGSPRGWDVPGDAVGYVVTSDQVELYDQAGEDRVLVSVLTQGNGMLLWNPNPPKSDPAGPLVRVVYHGEIIIDAWARRDRLRALPRGETQDADAPPTPVPGTPQLRLADVPQEVIVKKEVVLRAGAADTAARIGVIEADTAVYVLDIVAGWASVLPKSLHVAPPDQGQFWASATELGLRRPPAPR